MKIIVTGSLGHVSKPLTQELIKAGHSVTVISSKAEKRAEIEALGATAATGSMEDVDFLTATFTGADAVYCMFAASGNFSAPENTEQKIIADAGRVADNYVRAIVRTGVKQVVYLSTVGAHTDKGNGLLAMHYLAEKKLEKLPADIAVSFLRPVGFYDNLYNFIGGIKAQGVIASNYGGEDRVVLVSPQDIAAVAAEELVTPATGQKIRYIGSEDFTCNEAAAILGAAIGKPELKWVIITDEQLLGGLKAFGMNESIASSFVELNAWTHTGQVYEDYDLHKPVLGKVKLKEFASDFAAVYAN